MGRVEAAAAPVAEPTAPEVEQAPPEVDPSQPVPLTVEEQAAKYAALMDGDDLPEEFGDRIAYWLEDANGNSVPVRLRDAKTNGMLYSDYQRKTRELAVKTREVEAMNSARRAWLEDLTSGDGARGLRALNAVGAQGTLKTLVIDFIRREAAIEAMPAHAREQFREGIEAQERYELLQRRLEQQQLEAQRAAEEQTAQQGMAAPDVQYTLQSLESKLPTVLASAGIDPSDGPVTETLGRLIKAEVDGVRAADGTWIKPPSIQRGRGVSEQLLRQLAVAARQQVEQAYSGYSRRAAPRAAAQLPPTLAGTGPAPKAGTPGNISAPVRRRVSEMK
jgi:hypothetical protein